MNTKLAPKPACIAFLRACEHTRARPCTYLCLLSCTDLRICIWFGCSSERDRFTDTADEVQATMLALSLLECLFGLLINHSISDKTPNCFNVVLISMLTLAHWWILKAGRGRNLDAVSTQELALLCETSKKIKPTIMPDPSLTHDREIFLELFVAAFQ